MTDYAETSYNSWTGRKATSLRRRLLDCGHPNVGEVHYHYWCDRLTCCPACAEAEHDCGLFKGKSSSGKEAVPVEAAAPLTRNADRPRQPFTLTPADYVALYGPTSLAADVRMMTGAEVAEFDRRQQLSIECGRMGRTLDCGGCDGLALDNFPCVHDCHEPAVCSCPEVDISAFGDQPRAQVSKGYDPGCRVCPDPYAPPVDAASEPDSDVPLATGGIVHGTALRTPGCRGCLTSILGPCITCRMQAESPEVDCCGHRAELLFGHIGGRIWPAEDLDRVQRRLSQINMAYVVSFREPEEPTDA